jgi:phage terminase large subunit
VFANASHQLRWIPFVNDDQIRPVEDPVEVDRFEIASDIEVRVSVVKVFDHLFTMVRNQIAQTPRFVRLKYAYAMSTGVQFRYDAAQEMGVAVIPIRDY